MPTVKIWFLQTLVLPFFCQHRWDFFSAFAGVGGFSCPSVLFPALVRHLPQLTVLDNMRERDGGKRGEAWLLCASGRRWQQLKFLSCITENILYLLQCSTSEIRLQLAVPFIYLSLLNSWASERPVFLPSCPSACSGLTCSIYGWVSYEG